MNPPGAHWMLDAYVQGGATGVGPVSALPGRLQTRSSFSLASPGVFAQRPGASPGVSLPPLSLCTPESRSHALSPSGFWGPEY